MITSPSSGRVRDRTDWRALLAMYWLTSLVEAMGVGQIYAFMPNRLAELHMDPAQIPHLVGIIGALFFVFGLPFVPLWGVWADKYSRKAVIIRSALVEAVVFAGIALSHEVWQLVGFMLLVGFQLGNTGVMLAALREVTPRRRLGLAIGVFGSANAIGFSLGAIVGGAMIGQLGISASGVYGLSAILSVAIAVMLAVGSREVRPEVVPTGPVVRLAFGAVKGVIADPQVRWLFAIFGTAFVARQMANPFLPLVVARTDLQGMAPASGTGLVLGLGVLLGAGLSSTAGWIGDRVGFRPVLLASLIGSAAMVAAMPFLPTVGTLALAATFFFGLNASIGVMVFALLAADVPPERRSATLNLVYLPLYLAGIVGPGVGAVVVTAGLPAVFLVAALALLAGAVAVVPRGPVRKPQPHPASRSEAVRS